MVWQKNGTPDTLTGTSSTLTIFDLTAEQINQFLFHGVTRNASGTNEGWEYNNDSNLVYADRQSLNGGGDSLRVSQDNIITTSSGTSESFSVNYTTAVVGEEKISIIPTMNGGLTGAANAPNRVEVVGKYVPSPDAEITQVRSQTNDSNTWGTDSNLSALVDIPGSSPIPIGGWVELDRTILGSAGDSIAITGLANKRYYMVLSNYVATGGGIRANWQLNGDTSGNYANRRSTNGSADTTTLSDTNIQLTPSMTSTNTSFHVSYFSNLSTREKLNQNHHVGAEVTGAGTAPIRSDVAGKHAQTTNSINQINLIQDSTGDFNTGSEVVVLGWDPDDTHTTNFWEELASVELGSAGSNLSSGTFTAKKYLWFQCHLKLLTGLADVRMTYNNDTGSNYATRSNTNSDADGEQTNNAFIQLGFDFNNWKNSFANCFIINNSATEKLAIMHTVSQNDTGAGEIPLRRAIMPKWANTSSQITEIDLNGISGNLDTGSIIKVWGSD